MRILDGVWQGSSSRTYQVSRGELTVVPEYGGKIVSIRGREGREWLLQSAGPLRSPPVADGADFVGSGLCGWDECAPTIDASRLRDGTVVPDHGELWRGPWQWVDEHTLAVRGRVLDYVLTRRVEPTEEGFRLCYTVVTDRPGGLPFLWAAHPQLLLEKGSTLGLDPQVRDALLVWPEAEGHIVRVPVEPSVAVAPGHAQKVYLRPEQRVGSVVLTHPDGAGLRLTWDPALVPYLGLWIDRTCLAHRDVVAVEPSTGWFDDLARSVELGRVLGLEPGSSFSWWVAVALR